MYVVRGYIHTYTATPTVYCTLVCCVYAAVPILHITKPSVKFFSEHHNHEDANSYTLLWYPRRVLMVFILVLPRWLMEMPVHKYMYVHMAVAILATYIYTTTGILALCSTCELTAKLYCDK